MTLPLATVRDEVVRVLDAVATADLDVVAALLEDRERRWFRSGQGRSGLVAQMAARPRRPPSRPVTC